jgi:hypothetical protein
VCREFVRAGPDKLISGPRHVRELTVLVTDRRKLEMIDGDSGTELSLNAVLA